MQLENMTTKAELACVYSALILVDDDIAVTVSICCMFYTASQGIEVLSSIIINLHIN